MSDKITGRATITVDGERLRTESGATLSVGGSNRTAKMGGGEVHGYQEEDVQPSMECSVFHTKETSLRKLSDITGATVLFETDTGSQFILRNAWVMEPASINANDGTISLKLEALACDEV